LASYHPARNLVGDFFLRNRRKRPETCERSHGVFSLNLSERTQGRNFSTARARQGLTFLLAPEVTAAQICSHLFDRLVGAREQCDKTPL
jgi:hypothetical protein